MASIVSLPSNVLVRILQYLPFRDRVTIGGVNKLFHKLSVEAIDQTKHLELTNDLVEYSIRSHPFRLLLESCSPELKSINGTFTCDKRLLEILPEFLYPKLRHLQFTVANSTDDEYIAFVKETFRKLIKRNRNIRSITLWAAYHFEFPTDANFDQLERFEIHCNVQDDKVYESLMVHPPVVSVDDVFKSLTDRVPNLKHLYLISAEEEEGGQLAIKISLGTLDKFLGSVPHLKTLHLIFLCYDVEDGFVNQLPNLWRLNSLTELQVQIHGELVVDDFLPLDGRALNKIATSFPQLETFISRSIFENGNVILTLMLMKHLRNLHFPNLVIAKVVFTPLVAFFPSLTHLEIASIADVTSTNDFIDVLTSIPHNDKAKLTIQFNSTDFRTVWDSECVKAVLENMKTNGGPHIEFTGKEDEDED